MKTFITKNDNINRIEFWGATTIFVFLVFFHITDAMGNDWRAEIGPGISSNPVGFHFVSGLIRYTVLYTSFLFLNFVVVPALIRREALVKNISLFLLTFLFVAVAFGITETYIKHQFTGTAANDPYIIQRSFQQSFLYAVWLMMVFVFYTVIRYAGLYLLQNAEALRSRYRLIAPGTLAASIVWMIIMFLLLTSDAERPLKAVWAIVPVVGILFHSYAFNFIIPQTQGRKEPFRNYAGRTVLVLVIAFLPVTLIGALLTENGEGGAAISSFNSAFQLFITAPLTWVLFKRFQQGNAEIYKLKTELGQSHASFDFLRSQINPHFLFNALNTIYGTALQEGAERTGEGIERLGDMMRFMLQENMQKQISLNREIEYLNNYIALQKLRTDVHPNIRIETEIDTQVTSIQVAPMLLIPFVENAFKHGISFREPSYIKVMREVRDRTLYFDVANSKHAKGENDPERHKSGIGLNNVRQRLQLLHPGQHELVIRETKKDFFVHLTLTLT